MRSRLLSLSGYTVLLLVCVYRGIALSATDGQEKEDDESEGAGGSSTSTKKSRLECGLWLAPSTIPGAGLGMYAGREFRANEPLQQSGDGVVVITDIYKHHHWTELGELLFHDYAWVGEELLGAKPGLYSNDAMSIGFGSAANSFLPLVNVLLNARARFDPLLHRSKDPGAGGFSPYANRTSTATRDIYAGEELFVSYTDKWFLDEGRQYMGPIPLTHDLKKGDWLFRKYQRLHEATSLDESVLQEVWDTFVKNSPYRDSSRVFGAFHHDDPLELVQLQSKNLTQLRIEQSTRSLEWLEEHGVCGDHIRAGVSTIPQAGRGAFATRNLPAGTIVSHLPLIHTQRHVIEMFPLTESDEPRSAEQKGPPTSLQLVLNYCFGHRHSTLLFFPYGPMASFVNHNQTLANVKLQWSNKSNHKSEFLEKDVAQLDDSSSVKVAMEFVATRDIAEGEEVFLDYGNEWEEAWKKHVENWKPPSDGSRRYRSSYDLLRDMSRPLPTVFEMTDEGIDNVQTRCKLAFAGKRWRTAYKAGRIGTYLEHASILDIPCDIMRYNKGKDGKFYYTAVLFAAQANMFPIVQGKLVNVPREAFLYHDLPYTTDDFLPNALRHDIRIPDELFPDAWKNLR